MNDKKLEPVSEAFNSAVQQHQVALGKYGAADARTVEALYMVMLLAPDWLFCEMEEIALAPRH